MKEQVKESNMREEIECKTKLTDRRNEMKNKLPPKGF